MISIKDYARDTGVTYEAVRQRIQRYQEELEGHIHKKGRIKFLDDVAVAILNDHRLPQDLTVIYDRGAGEDFRKLQADLDKAEKRAAEYWDQLKLKEQTMAALVDENQELRLQARDVAKLEANNKLAQEKASEASEAAQKAQNELKTARERERLLNQYATDLEAWSALGWFKRKRTPKPQRPELPEEG